MLYWVSIAAILVGLNGIVSNWNWQDELKKLTGDGASTILRIFYLLTLVSGAFVLRDTYAQGGGLGGVWNGAPPGTSPSY